MSLVKASSPLAAIIFVKAAALGGDQPSCAYERQTEAARGPG